MTDLHLKLLKRYKVDPDFYEGWVKQALKRGSLYKSLFDKLNKAFRKQEILGADLEQWNTRHYIEKGFKTKRRQVWGARCKQVAVEVEAAMVEIVKACKRDKP